MKGIAIFFFFAVAIFNSSIAQVIKFSEEIKENRNAKFMRILGADENGNVYVLRSNISLETDRDRVGFKSRVYFLQYLNQDLKLIWELELAAPYENGRIADVQINNGRVVVVSFLNDRKSKSYTFFIQALSDKGGWIGSPVEIDKFIANDLDEDDKPGVINSQDELSMAFSYRKISIDKKIQIYQVVVMDTSFSIRYKKQIEIQGSTSMYIPVSFLLSNQSSFFALGVHYTTEKRTKSQSEMYYELHGYNPVNDQFLHSLIKSESKFLTDVGFSIDNYNKRVIAAGFYSDLTTYSIAGIFYNSFSEDNLTQISSQNSAFPVSYFQKFTGERKLEKNKELVNYSIDRLIVRRDGGVAILAESFNRAERSYWDYYMQTYVYHYYYHYGNVMVLSINPSGEILWANAVSKDQNSIDDSGYSSSYLSSIVNGKILSFYNKYIGEESSVLLTTIDGIGAQKTDVLFNENERITIIPKSAKQIDEETILMPAYKQNKFYILKINP